MFAKLKKSIFLTIAGVLLVANIAWAINGSGYYSSASITKSQDDAVGPAYTMYNWILMTGNNDSTSTAPLYIRLLRESSFGWYVVDYEKALSVGAWLNEPYYSSYVANNKIHLNGDFLCKGWGKADNPVYYP